ncbi:hypothetical protein C8J56DRAFT_899340 [Mycena floridula]|nr:hypothetical protein C8J56DRAFT_899340 [Mycena floridula]
MLCRLVIAATLSRVCGALAILSDPDGLLDFDVTHFLDGYRISQLLKDQANAIHLSLGMYHGVDVAAFMKELIGNFPPSLALVIVFIGQAIGVTLKWVSVDWDLRVILGDDTEDHDFSDAQIIRDFMIQCDRPDVDTGWTAELGQCEMAQGIQQKRGASKAK